MYEYGASRTYVGGYFGEFWAYETAGIIQNEAEAKLWKESHGRKDSKGNWILLHFG